MARVWHAFATVTGRHSCVSCCTLASFERGLSCIPRFALEVRCWSYQSFMLPTLGGYIREVALFALCCSCLLIAAPALIIYFTFVILRSVCLLLYFCSLTLFWFLFFFFFFHKISCGTGASRRISRIHHCS